MPSQKRRFSDAAKSFSKRMKIPMAPKKKFIKPSNLNLNQVGPELKYVDTEATDTAVPAGTSSVDFVLLNSIAQGSDNTNRIGRKITVKSIDINAIFTGMIASGTTGTPSAMIRWWVLVDAQPDGATATPADVWKSTSTFAVAHRNLDTSERFKILRTGTFDLCNQSSAAGNSSGAPSAGFPDKAYLDIYIPLNDAVKYSGTSTGISNIASGAYYFCYCADIATPLNTTGCTVVYDARVKFTDE